MEFLLGSSPDNPGHAMGDIMVRLAQAGATVIGMPCNTAHSAPMLDVALERLKKSGFTGRFIHMITATADYLRKTFPEARRIGVLCTQGAYASQVFTQHFQPAGLEVIYPDDAGRDALQHAISDPDFGIKAFSQPVTAQARGARPKACAPGRRTSSCSAAPSCRWRWKARIFRGLLSWIPRAFWRAVSSRRSLPMSHAPTYGRGHPRTPPPGASSPPAAAKTRTARTGHALRQQPIFQAYPNS